jgi:hypothetical protein
MDNRMTEAPVPTSRQRGSRAGSGKGRRGLTLGLSALGACLLLFLGGFFVGRSGLTAARNELEKNKAESAAKVAKATTETETAQAALAAEQARAQVGTARTWLYRSAVQLDRRNFGTAQTDLKQAATLMESGNLAAAGLSPSEAQSLKDAIQGINLSVSADTEAMRGQILQVAEQMDTLFDARSGAETPGNAETAPVPNPVQ